LYSSLRCFAFSHSVEATATPDTVLGSVPMLAHASDIIITAVSVMSPCTLVSSNKRGFRFHWVAVIMDTYGEEEKWIVWMFCSKCSWQSAYSVHLYSGYIWSINGSVTTNLQTLCYVECVQWEKHALMKLTKSLQLWRLILHLLLGSICRNLDLKQCVMQEPKFQNWQFFMSWHSSFMKTKLLV